jgi:AAA15 family ATPase/GTPase
MRVSKLSVTNFKGLQSVSIDKTFNANVVVGPNAVGKSTLLEAMRFSKVLLAPRLPNEAQQMLIQSGVLSPQNQAIGGPSIDIAALANKPEADIAITLELELSEEDLAHIRNETSNLALILIHSETIHDSNESPLAFTQFLSTEEGNRALTDKLNDVEEKISNLSAGAKVVLELTISGARKLIQGDNPFGQALVALLDRRLPSHKTLFSMFPADRALPQGEQPLQLGSADTQQQVISHMANPSLKYARLKQAIIQGVMLDSQGRQNIENEFNLIFDHLLPGKKLEGIRMNSLGLLKILVRDLGSGKIFDIDQMSSGEKGLVLTFYFIRTSMERGGIVLLDEPELHLNASVQARILDFLIKHCIEPLSLQVFLCTHSPEIVRDAYERRDCGLFHLRGPDDLTPILKQDQHELFEVFERLGSSPADVLFTRGNVYVEGEHDSQILQAGFPEILSGLKVTSLGGGPKSRKRSVACKWKRRLHA